MKTLRHLTAFLFCLVLGNTLWAQDYVDLLKFRYESTPLNGYEGVEGGNARIDEFTLDATVPVVLNDRVALITGFIGESLSSKFTPNDTNVTQVFGTTLKLGLNVQHNDRLSIQYVLLPKISSDFIEIGSDDIQLGGVVLAKYAKNDYFKWKYGLYYNGELFGAFFVPLFGFYYHRPGSPWEFDITLPLAANANYAFNQKWSAGAHFGAFVRTYNLNKPFFTEQGEYLQKNNQELYFYGRFEPVKNVLLEAGAGFTVGRRFGIYDEEDRVRFGVSAFMFGDERPEPANPNIKDGMIFSLRAVYRYPL
ncbi:hypothetical protein HZ996_05715 [Cryomorphaceae bacterium]|nr:hypothetical protein HZ996_05715 [Cryomorphaceae bacterium]